MTTLTLMAVLMVSSTKATKKLGDFEDLHHLRDLTNDPDKFNPTLLPQNIKI